MAKGTDTGNHPKRQVGREVYGGVPEGEAAWRFPGGDGSYRDAYVSGRDTGTSRKFKTTPPPASDRSFMRRLARDPSLQPPNIS